MRDQWRLAAPFSQRQFCCDLRSLLRAFTQVFPAAALWQLNDGDVLLTGAADDVAPDALAEAAPSTAAADLLTAGVADPMLLRTLRVMHGRACHAALAVAFALPET